MTEVQATGRSSAMVHQAVERLRDLIATGELPSYLAVDNKSGEPVHPEARQLFASLPAVTPATGPDEIIALGLWSALPHNLRRAFDTPRYRVGRELFVRTTVSHRSADRYRPTGAFDSSMPPAYTHRAELRGRAGDSFVVAVDGAPAPLRFSRPDVFAANEPTVVPLAGSLSGVQIDYSDPLMKAHVCAAYLEIAAEAAKLDFAAPEAALVEAQAALVRRLAARVRMSYAGRGEGYSGPRAGALIAGGQGVCFVQRAVAIALLAPFARTLGFDLQAALGRTLRLGTPRGFAIVTLRPSLARYVVDPAWGEPLTDVRIAFFGPSWGHDRRLEGFEGAPDTRVPPEAIDLPEVAAS